jgi:hypothetical protein
VVAVTPEGPRLAVTPVRMLVVAVTPEVPKLAVTPVRTLVAAVTAPKAVEAIMDQVAEATARRVVAEATARRAAAVAAMPAVRRPQAPKPAARKLAAPSKVTIDEKHKQGSHQGPDVSWPPGGSHGGEGRVRTMKLAPSLPNITLSQ